MQHDSTHTPPTHCPHSFLPCPPQDRPLLNGAGQTISAPHMHAICLELLADHLAHPGSTALDVGSGSGYLTAAMAALAAPGGGRVLGVEQVRRWGGGWKGGRREACRDAGVGAGDA
jgi:protein-L-isoaspartate O-methyltransferase